jgi:hypothetical protein
MPFQLPNQTSFALQKPTYSGSTWVRPADWISITDTPGEVQFLVSSVVLPIYALRTTFVKPSTQNLYIDWGDGVIDTITTSTSTTTNHTYTGGTGTPCSRGYETWKVRVYVDAGAQITEAVYVRPTYYVLSTLRGSAGLLEEYYGDGTIETASNLHITEGANTPRFLNLEYSKLPSIMTGATTMFDNTYNDCRALRKIVMPVSAPNATSISGMIINCYSLEEIILPQDMINITTMTTFASTCYMLVNVVLPPTMNSCSDFSFIFQNCVSLGSIQLPQSNSATTFQGAFFGCRMLLNIEIKSWTSTITTINFASSFQNCYTLEDIKLPPSITSGATMNIFSMFVNCYSLKSFTSFPINFNTTTLQSTFQFCYSLSNVILPTSIPSLTNMSNAFNGCSQLAKITLPTTIGASIDVSSAFNNCYGLSEIVIPSSWNPTSFNSTFQGCVGLKRISLPPVGPTSFVNMCNSCFSLEEVVMPTNMTGVQLFGGAFGNCFSLTGLTMPSVANSITSMSAAFQNCGNLQQITLPTSMTGCPNWSNAFQNCSSLRSCVLPATATAGITTFASTFTSCYSLESITLPNTQMTSLTTIQGMVDSCISLTGITNADKLGNTSTASTIYVNGTDFAKFNQTASFDLYTKFSKFVTTGYNTNARSPLSSLRLRNNGAGQYAGTSPQIDIKFNSLGQAALVQVFNDLPTITAKTIDITANVGSALLTPAERAIATGKGWTIVG